MSWEVVSEDIEKARCACGKGFVTRHVSEEGDDWNRYRPKKFGEKIDCEDCASRYHLEYLNNQRGEIAYLVPNGCTILARTEKSRLPFEQFINFENRAVALFTKKRLLDVIDDMSRSKYSTRLSLDQSKKIVEMFYQDRKSRKLANIISVLEKCVAEYEDFEWNFEKVQAFRRKEAETLRENRKEKDRILSLSHRLSFHCK